MSQIMNEIRQTPEAIAVTIEESGPEAAAAAEELWRRQADRIFIMGNGSSYYVALAGTYVSRELANGSSPLVIPMTAGEFNLSSTVLRPSDAIVAVSASGEYRGVVDAFDRYRSHLRIAITQEPDSTLATSADLVVLGRGGTQNVPVSTKTVATTFVALSSMLLRLHDAAPAYERDLEQTADRCAAAIRDGEAAVPDIVENLDTCQHAFVFGSGSGYAASLEGALKLKEMAGLHAESSESTEMATGPSTMVDEETRCIALVSGPGDPATEVVAQVPSWGATLIEVGGSPGAGRGLAMASPYPDNPCFAMPSLTLPIWMLAVALAEKRGRTPEDPHWRERYAQQGLDHIMG